MNPKKQQKYFSIEGEPALGATGDLHPDPSEEKVARREERKSESPAAEIDRLRDSIASEPSLDPQARRMLGGQIPDFGLWLAANKARVGFFALVFVTLLAGIAGGPFSVLGALAQSVLRHNFIVYATYMVVVGPLVEEMLKQSGTLFLLERRPYWLQSGLQFPIIAVISAGIFATIENFMYMAGPLQELSPEKYAAAVSFRWRYCTLLHIGCSLIASVGLWQVWRRQVEENAPARLSHGYRWIVTAVVCHGLYNFLVTFLYKE